MPFGLGTRAASHFTPAASAHSTAISPMEPARKPITNNCSSASSTTSASTELAAPAIIANVVLSGRVRFSVRLRSKRAAGIPAPSASGHKAKANAMARP